MKRKLENSTEASNKLSKQNTTDTATYGSLIPTIEQLPTGNHSEVIALLKEDAC